MSRVCVVICAEQAKLPAPLVPKLRRLCFEPFPKRKRRIHTSVAGQRTLPIFFQRKNSISSAFGNLGSKKEAAILDQNFPDIGIWLPTEPTPYCFINVIVYSI